jgi:hypothetical protein
MHIKELILQTKQLNQLYEFYKTTLQLQVTQTDSKTISIKAGKTTLIFQEANSIINPFYHFAFNIPANKIAEALEWLKNKAEVLWIEDYKNYIAEFNRWHARSVYFIDAAGNIVELIARFDLHNDDAAAFSSSQILNVSEIGIVFETEKLDEGTIELLHKFQLQYFPKQPPMQHFRAIGDDEGLFIVVPAQRNWYPKNIQSGTFPLSILFENDNTEFRLKL